MRFHSILYLVYTTATTVVALLNDRQYEGSYAIYFNDNDPNGASVVAWNVATNGSIYDPLKVSTGGKGRVNIDAQPVPRNKTIIRASPLFSADILVVGEDGTLLTVNAGDNTVVAFSIPEENPQQLQMIGKPVSSGGDIPNSIAYSSQSKIACTINTGTRNGVVCYTLTSTGLQQITDLFPLAINQTVPAVGVPNTSSDISFSPDGKFLVATVKGVDGTEAGWTYVWQVSGNSLSQPRLSRPPGPLINFSINWLSNSSFVMTDPLWGSYYLNINTDLSATVTANTKVTGSVAICWGAVYKNWVFLMDAFFPNIPVADRKTGELLYFTIGSEVGAGNYDAVVLNDHLYVLQATRNIGIWDLRGAQPRFRQLINLESFGSRLSWSGMASWPKQWY